VVRGSGLLAIARPQNELGGLCAFLDRDAFVLQQGLQLAGLKHLAHDIAAADEFAFDIKLRDGRPIRIRLDAAAYLVIRLRTVVGQGTLMHLGIGPIVTGSIIMQLFTGAKIINLDLTDRTTATLHRR